MQSIIGFVSDFGLEDAWVGVCRAVIYGACPQARVVDFAHQIPPFDIRKGAVVASAGVWQLPDAIHLVVVDPGVGGGRKDLCIVTEGGTMLVGPDNGVLLPAAWHAGGVKEAYSIDASKLAPGPPLATFHARDVLAPAAAALACGVEPRSLGERLDPADLVRAPYELAHRENGVVVTEVLDVDRFGSLRLGVYAEQMEEFGFQVPRLDVALGHLTVKAPLGRTFSDVGEGEPVCMLDSSGLLALALRLASAAERYGVEPGDGVRIHPIG
ncbi:MAG TPA: SAM-dependent chlorinase/fluorinase [Coriobacteriia bacterium]